MGRRTFFESHKLRPLRSELRSILETCPSGLPSSGGFLRINVTLDDKYSYPGDRHGWRSCSVQRTRTDKA